MTESVGMQKGMQNPYQAVNDYNNCVAPVNTENSYQLSEQDLDAVPNPVFDLPSKGNGADSNAKAASCCKTALKVAATIAVAVIAVAAAVAVLSAFSPAVLAGLLLTGFIAAGFAAQSIPIAAAVALAGGAALGLFTAATFAVETGIIVAGNEAIKHLWTPSQPQDPQLQEIELQDMANVQGQNQE